MNSRKGFIRIRVNRGPRLPAILLATHSPEVLNKIPTDVFQTREAVSTLGVMSALKANPVLVIADVDDLLEYPELSRDALRTALKSIGQSGAVVVTSAAFNAESDRWIGEALLTRGLRSGVGYMPPRVVVVTNYCGGIGKTTLSLAMAKQFRKTSGLATAVVEAGVGGSSLNARLLGGKRTTLYEIITQNANGQQWEGVDVYPSDNWESGVLVGDERTVKTLHDIVHGHTMTIFDVFPANPLWKHILEMATDILVVSSPRPDAIAQTDAIFRLLKDETAALDPQPRTYMVLNQVRSIGERLPLAGQLSTWLPYDERGAERLDGSLSGRLLNLVYPGWESRKVGKKGNGHGEEAKS